jgi:hypothetical protein
MALAEEIDGLLNGYGSELRSSSTLEIAGIDVPGDWKSDEAFASSSCFTWEVWGAGALGD